MSCFSQFKLDSKILKLLGEIGFNNPTSIQELAIPKILEGSDLIASAQTGTGKTAAFMLPILHLLTSQERGKGPQVLVLVPTRELAIQVSDEAKKLSKYLSKIRTVCIYGGVPYPVQKRDLAKPYEILVATPGRLLDHIHQGRIHLNHLKLLVLDEADRMLDMGFVDDVEEIAKMTPKSRQTLLFSATIDNKIIPFSRKLQKNPYELRVEVTNPTQVNIEQRLYYVDNIRHKVRLLDHILGDSEMNQTIIFTSTKRQANDLALDLREKGYHSSALHGDMNQRQRTQTITKMRTGKIKVLVATDVAARGIDISTLSHVINFDLPRNPEDFIHRIGRTGRAGASGVAITFATYQEEKWISKIKNLIDHPLQAHTIQGMEPTVNNVAKKGPPPFRKMGKRKPFMRNRVKR